KPSYGRFDKGGSDNTRGRKPSFGKGYPKRSESTAEPKRASYRFGSEWKDKPYSEKTNENRDSARGTEKTPFDKRNSGRFDSENSEKQTGEMKTVYKGRGRDQKPRYETIRSEEADRKQSS